MQQLIHPLDEQKEEIETKKESFKLAVFFILMVVGGIMGGLLVANLTTRGTHKNVFLKKENVVTKAGIKDEKVFKDTAEGVLRKGGVDGEGSYHLERKGGESQNVYLTSTTVDLSQFVGKRVKVWGKTYKAKVAGWLMDVGYIEVK